MNPFFQKLRSLMHRRRKEDELREELQFHLDEEAEERQAEGLAGEEARRAARRDMGNITLVQEETRAVWTWTLPGTTGAGLPLRLSHDGGQQDLQHAGDSVAGARHRSQHGDL